VIKRTYDELIGGSFRITTDDEADGSVMVSQSLPSLADFFMDF
jgi:hypothetical protein